MTERSQQLQQCAEERERDILAKLDVRACLSRATATKIGLARFAEAFYFCRVGFVRLNFILGQRCAIDERLWVGLARNLWEEAGGGSTLPHNALYRAFLNYATTTSENNLIAPAFADQFDHKWESYIRTASILDALLAFAVYEALDAPDYQMLYDALRPNAPDAKLEFFRVHTDVRHVELFDDALALLKDRDADEQVRTALDFVVGLQEDMWRGLLDHVHGATIA